MADKMFENNQVSIIGEIVSDFQFSHEVYGEGFYMMEVSVRRLSDCMDYIPVMVSVDCQHFFRQIFLGYFSDIVQAFDTLRKNVCGDDYTSLHNPIVLSSVLPAYGMFHSIQILFL